MNTTLTTIAPADNEWLGRAVPEPVLEPSLSIIDTHMHLWAYDGHRYFLEEYARDVAACGHNVEASVYVECFAMYRAHGPEHLKPVGETEHAVGMAAMAASGNYTLTRAAAAIIGFADLRLGDRTREALDTHIEAANGRFRGIRHRAKWDPDPEVRGHICADGPGLLLEPEFGVGVDLLTSKGLLLEASIFHPQTSDVTALARAHPDATIVVNHTGSPVGYASYAGMEAEVYARWLADMKELAKCPKVSIKMGGLLMCLRNFDFTSAERPPTSEELAALWRPYLESCIDVFGADRCMVSSNFPVDKAGFGYGTVWNMFKHITRGCSEDEKKKIYSDTAMRVYQLDLS